MMSGQRKTQSARALLIIALMAVFAIVAVVRPFAPRDPAGPPSGFVQHVFDGDTILLASGRRIRYIGMDTPEMDSGSESTREIAGRARDFNRRIVEGKTVRLEYDIETTDRYGRTLAYVWAGDTFVNAELVREGLARAKTYGDNTRYAKDFERFEAAARAARKGLWANR